MLSLIQLIFYPQIFFTKNIFKTAKKVRSQKTERRILQFPAKKPLWQRKRRERQPLRTSDASAGDIIGQHTSYGQILIKPAGSNNSRAELLLDFWGCIFLGCLC